jgi:hypothetical protein
VQWDAKQQRHLLYSSDRFLFIVRQIAVGGAYQYFLQWDFWRRGGPPSGRQTWCNPPPK